MVQNSDVQHKRYIPLLELVCVICNECDSEMELKLGDFFI